MDEIWTVINKLNVKGYKDGWVRSNKISLGILVKMAIFYIFKVQQENRRDMVQQSVPRNMQLRDDLEIVIDFFGIYFINLITKYPLSSHFQNVVFHFCARKLPETISKPSLNYHVLWGHPVSSKEEMSTIQARLPTLRACVCV